MYNHHAEYQILNHPSLNGYSKSENLISHELYCKVLNSVIQGDLDFIKQFFLDYKKYNFKDGQDILCYFRHAVVLRKFKNPNYNSFKINLYNISGLFMLGAVSDRWDVLQILTTVSLQNLDYYRYTKDLLSVLNWAITNLDMTLIDKVLNLGFLQQYDYIDFLSNELNGRANIGIISKIINHPTRPFKDLDIYDKIRSYISKYNDDTYKSIDILLHVYQPINVFGFKYAVLELLCTYGLSSRGFTYNARGNRVLQNKPKCNDKIFDLLFIHPQLVDLPVVPLMFLKKATYADHYYRMQKIIEDSRLENNDDLKTLILYSTVYSGDLKSFQILMNASTDFKPGGLYNAVLMAAIDNGRVDFINILLNDTRVNLEIPNLPFDKIEEYLKKLDLYCGCQDNSQGFFDNLKVCKKNEIVTFMANGNTLYDLSLAVTDVPQENIRNLLEFAVMTKNVRSINAVLKNEILSLMTIRHNSLLNFLNDKYSKFDLVSIFKRLNPYLVEDVAESDYSSLSKLFSVKIESNEANHALAILLLKGVSLDKLSITSTPYFLDKYYVKTYEFDTQYEYYKNAVTILGFMRHFFYKQEASYLENNESIFKYTWDSVEKRISIFQDRLSQLAYDIFKRYEDYFLSFKIPDDVQYKIISKMYKVSDHELEFGAKTVENLLIKYNKEKSPQKLLKFF